jgi:hypothetical protein
MNMYYIYRMDKNTEKGKRKIWPLHKYNNFQQHDCACGYY